MGDAVTVEGLEKRYGDIVAVDGLSFTAPEGAVFALLGPNGAGKTTVVECLEGFREPDAGSVRVLGLDPWSDRTALASRIGVMLQDGGAWPAANPREMIRLYARLYADPLDPDELLDEVGLSGRARSPYRALSAGERQRVNLALALVGRPELVFLDEPTAGLDVRARRLVWDTIDGLRDTGATVVLTSHHAEEVERLADLAAVIDAGRLVALDSPAALLAGGGPVRVQTPDRIDPDELAGALGAQVRPEGPGRWAVQAGPEAVPSIAAWFAERGLAVTSIRAADLDDVLLRLTGDES